MQIYVVIYLCNIIIEIYDSSIMTILLILSIKLLSIKFNGFHISIQNVDPIKSISKTNCRQ